MSTSTAMPNKSDPSQLLQRRPIKKPTRSSTFNEEDEFSAERLLKAAFITVLTLGLIIGFFYHVSVVVNKIFQARSGWVQAVAVGVLGLVVNASVSVKAVRFLNKVLFIKEDAELEKKYL